MIRFLIDEFLIADLSRVSFLVAVRTVGVFFTLNGVLFGEPGVLGFLLTSGVPVRSTKCIDDRLRFEDSLRTALGVETDDVDTTGVFLRGVVRTDDRVVDFDGVNEVMRVPDKLSELNFDKLFSLFGGVSSTTSFSCGSSDCSGMASILSSTGCVGFADEAKL